MSYSVILASSSKYRKELLSRILEDFTCISPNIDETPFPDEEPIEHVARLAEQKALAVAVKEPNAIVIGSDQICVLDGQILGKPGNQENTIKQLTACSGKSVYFYTSLCVTKGVDEPSNITVVTTKVTFRDLAQTQIKSYIKRENPIDCAGSFKCEGLGIALFEAIESKDPTALIGLPLIEVAKQLDKFEINIL
ncbi:nucleoside triphosphate pyrophosphatase [Kangiella sp. TOML190]|uniref:Maf family protein n=1 Tax=Kangiella sp. TOML190 TaxID=2931351 RepID=UPI00203C3DD6|nr:Maf family protein [Kangiella sp. TOML190]